MRKLQAINFIDGLIEASLMVVLPLLLISRNVEVTQIGLVLAFSPFAFLVFRLLFASIADFLGVKRFFILNALAGSLCNLIYAFTPGLSGYAVGKIFEGINSASIWAVNRTALKSLSKERDPSVDSARINTIRIFAYSFATLGAGFLLGLISFEGTFLLLAALGVVNLVISFFTREIQFPKGRPSLGQVLSQLDFREKPQVIITSSIVMGIASFGGALLFRLVLPIFMDSVGFTYLEIGLVLTLHWLFRGFSVFSTVKRLPMRENAIIGSVLIFLPLIVFPFASAPVAMILAALFGLGMGSVEVLWEKMIFHATRGSKAVSSDISLVQVAPTLGSIIALAIGGFMIDWFGYPPLFILSAICYVAYLGLGLGLLKATKK